MHERLAIVDPAGGAQPLRSADGELVLAVNGEIYNHRELERSLQQPYEFQTGSDCEVINALYRETAMSAAWLDRLNGIFAFALWDRDARALRSSRATRSASCPLYWGHDGDGRLWVASEMKALVRLCDDVAQFPPGHWYDSASGDAARVLPARLARLRRRAGRAGRSRRNCARPSRRAVHRQMMSDVPYGVLLSGGLDSSLVAAVRRALRAQARRGRRQRRKPGGRACIRSRSAWKARPTLPPRQIAADALGTVHHGFNYTFEEGLDALPDVIRHIESYDVTTIRASTPMYLLARRIKAMGVKMVLSGEGSDEIFGGYLYFHKAPDAREFHEELVRKLDALHNYDCLRANKSMMAWGVEPRVPFLDVEFLDVAMRMDAQAQDGRQARRRQQPDREGACCAKPSTATCRTRSCGGRRSSSATASATAGSTASRRMPKRRSAIANSRPPTQRFPSTRRRPRKRTGTAACSRTHFPGDACARHRAGRQVDRMLVAGGDRLGCGFANAADPSGRAVAGVHNDALGLNLLCRSGFSRELLIFVEARRLQRIATPR